jgi:regulatory protein
MQCQQERLAAAARALAAAEGLTGCRSSGPDDGTAPARQKPPPPPDPALEGTEPIPEDVARAIVLRQLSMGPRTRKQLEDKLRRRLCPDDIAEKVLDRMTDVGLVDDRAFAEMLVRSRQTGRGLAKRALAQELRTKGVDDELVAETLGSIDPESERMRAEELTARKLRTMGGVGPTVQARRLSGMLARKGYPPSVVYAVVRDAVNDAFRATLPSRVEHQRD